MRGDHILWCHWQHVEVDPLGISGRKVVETRCKGVEVFAGFGFEQGVVVPVDHLPKTEPLNQIVGDGGIAAEEAGGIATVVGQGLFEDFPAVLGLRPRKAVGHIGIGFAEYVGDTQRIALNGRFPGECMGTCRQRQHAQ